MNETEKQYRHSKLHGKCVASCNECIVEESRNQGITEGLLMAAEIVRKHTVKKAIFNSHPDGYALNDEILNKAKEVEELKVDK